MNHLRGLLISDANLQNFAAYLNNDGDDPPVQVTVAPYGQVIPTLSPRLGPSDVWKESFDFAVVWTQPGAISQAFKRLLDFQKVSTSEILDEVDAFSSALLNLPERVKFAFVPTWVVPTYHRGFGVLDLRNGIGIQNTLMRMNLRLADNLAGASNLYLLDSQKWLNGMGKDKFNSKLWYMGKIPFGNDVFKAAVKDVKAGISAIRGLAKKLVVLDLDNTLWGGVVGEIGWQKLRLGGHDHVGEAFVDFQRALQSLTNRGILLAIASKNEEPVALDAINSHPEMVLQQSDFAAWRINWKDKAQNIVDLASELNLGLQSVVFIDDNPVERGRVRETLPEVYVPDWPENATLYKETLLSLSCFDVASISDEDAKRVQMYREEQARSSLRKEISDLDDWLESLEIEVFVEELNEANLARATQLLNKTNQMNLSTRRLTETELWAWAREVDNKVWTFRVSDRFGTSGLTGITSLTQDRQKGRIVDFILSCRVMGRKIEETMVATAVEHARMMGLDEVYAEYLPSAKNKPCLAFWEHSGFRREPTTNRFGWQTDQTYPFPSQVTVRTGERMAG